MPEWKWKCRNLFGILIFFFPFRYIPTSEIFGSYGNSSISFWKSPIPFSIVVVAIYSPISNVGEFQDGHMISDTWNYQNFYFRHSDRCVVIHYYGFNVHFPDNIQFGASFSMLICHLYIFFSELTSLMKWLFLYDIKDTV